MSMLQTIAVVGIWASLLMLFYTYLGYPLLLRAIAACVPAREVPLGPTPSISLLIAAYNEERDIGSKIEQSLALDYPADRLEILVLSDASVDGTDAIVAACQDPRVRLVRSPERRGKTSVQNLGARAARGEILVFSDATAVYHPMALRYLAANYADASVGAVSGRYRYFDRDGDSATSSGMIAFWNYENWIKTLQSRIFSISGCCGCIYSVRRSAYTALPAQVISDLVQPLWVLKQKLRVVFEDRALAYEETTRSSREEFSMRVRVITRGMRGLLSVSDLLNPLRSGWVALQLLSHKVLRWLVPVALCVLLASSLAAWQLSPWRWLLAAQLALYATAGLSLLLPLHRLWKPLSMPAYFCTVNLAALRSLVEVARGRQYVTWQTVRSQHDAH